MNKINYNDYKLYCRKFNMSNTEDLGIPEEAIVKPEDERPVKREVLPEEVPNKDEAEYENLKQADFDTDGDDNPDWDPAV
jgi:hypothetical protein